MAKMTVYHGGFMAGRASGNPYREEYERFWNRILLYNYKRAGTTGGRNDMILKLCLYMRYV